jgi:fucose 4-O-acetylase-like acetyltransferase
VVLRHVLQYSVSDEGGILTNFIWAVQMPGFMLVAGYFSAREISDGKSVWNRIVKSAEHYALPFFSWFLLISCLLLGDFGRNPVKAVIALLNRVDYGLWFLWVVFVLSVIATFCNRALSCKRGSAVKTAAALSLCFGILAAIGLKAGINFLGIKFIFYYAVFYGFGWLVHWTQEWWSDWWPKAEKIVATLSLIVFVAIIYNYDLYHCGDDLISIGLRCIAGFTGNFVLLWVCQKYKKQLAKAKLGWIGRYTLEIYVTHMYVNGLMKADNGYGFFTVVGFGNFFISFVLTIVFTLIIIAVFKSIPVTNSLFYGKRKARGQ